MTVSALKHILNNDFLKNVKIFKSFLFDHNIVFFNKIINFRKNAFNFDFKNFFFGFHFKNSFFLTRRIGCLLDVKRLLHINTNKLNYRLFFRIAKNWDRSECIHVKQVELLHSFRSI